jgi:hypothetical protein
MKISKVNEQMTILTEEIKSSLKVCNLVRLLREEFALQSPSGTSDIDDDLDQDKVGDHSVDVVDGMRVLKHINKDNIENFEVEEIQNAIKTYMFLHEFLGKKHDTVKEMVAHNNIIKRHLAKKSDPNSPIAFSPKHGTGIK